MLSPKRKRLEPGEKVTLTLELSQVDLIVEHTSLGGGLLAMIHAAKVRDNIVRARCTLGELEKLSGCVGAEAQDTKDRELQKEFVAISEAITRVERAHYYDSSLNSSTRKRLKLVRIGNG